MLSNLPPVTKGLLVATTLLFVLQALLGAATFSPLMLWPVGAGGFDPFSPGENFQPWQLVTYAFLHSGPLQLVFNLIAIWMFGTSLELTWGPKRFGLFYGVCVAGAALCQLLVGWWATSQGADAYPIIGAAGGVYGLLLGYGMLFPNREIMLLFPPIPMKAKTMVFLFAGIAFLFGIGGANGNTVSAFANVAYLGGMGFGWLLIRYWRGQSPFRGGPRRGGPGGRGPGSGGTGGGGSKRPHIRIVK